MASLDPAVTKGQPARTPGGANAKVCRDNCMPSRLHGDCAGSAAAGSQSGNRSAGRTSTQNAVTPGSSATAPGSPFDASGQADAVYAGNPGTASLAHANSTVAVSQYDAACVQLSH